MMFSPLLPLSENFTGIVRPALAWLMVVLLIGEKNPVKLYRTVTLKLHDDVLPESSVAVAVTTVVPTSKSEPEALLVVTGTVESHESAAETLKLTGIETAVVFAGSVTTMSAEQLMT